jgi:release factor glutamine methyltransferase
VALAIASLAPGVKVVATEASAEAIALARENAEALGLADRVTLLGGDLLEPLARAGLADGVTAVVANLPYLSEADYAAAPPELGFEPRDALVAGPTGLEAIRRLAAELPSLRRLGFVALEIGATQGPAVAALLAESLAGWTVRIHCDLAGLDRVAIAERSATGGDAAP